MSAMRSASSITTISTSSRIDVAAAHEVGEPAGAGDGHVDAAAQRLELRTEADAAVERCDAALASGEQRAQLGMDLGGQFAGGREHECHAAARGGHGRRRSASGMPKASVLPDPVGALPQTSRPARAGGMASDWMANGSVMPRAAREATTAAGTPRSEKLEDNKTPGTVARRAVLAAGMRRDPVG